MTAGLVVTASQCWCRPAAPKANSGVQGKPSTDQARGRKRRRKTKRKKLERSMGRPKATPPRARWRQSGRMPAPFLDIVDLAGGFLLNVPTLRGVPRGVQSQLAVLTEVVADAILAAEQATAGEERCWKLLLLPHRLTLCPRGQADSGTPRGERASRAARPADAG